MPSTSISSNNTKNKPFHPSDALFHLAGAQALFVGHRLGLFEMLGSEKRTLEQIATQLNFSDRSAQALLSMCSAMAILTLGPDNRYGLTPEASTYLLRSSPDYYGGILDQGWAVDEIFSFKSFLRALETNTPQIYGGNDLFQSNEQEKKLTRTFTRTMHCKSIAAAKRWPLTIDLSRYSTLLDIGGGSGAHAIGATLHWPHLRCLIFERPLVCEVAQEYIEHYSLKGKIDTFEGDMWQDSFPQADLHFYSDIFHDWDLKKCIFLAEKSFASLPKGGRIILHEMTFNDSKTGPYNTAAYNVQMLLCTEGQQFSNRELMELLEKVGFSDLAALPSGHGDWHLITGEKN